MKELSMNYMFTIQVNDMKLELTNMAARAFVLLAFEKLLKFELIHTLYGMNHLHTNTSVEISLSLLKILHRSDFY